MNQVILIGRSSAAAELKYTPNGLAVVNLSVATNDGKADKKITSWHRVTLFGKTAEMFGPRIQKGTEIFIQGKLQYNQWEKNGVKMTNSYIVADWVRVIEQPNYAGSDVERGPSHGQQSTSPVSRGGAELSSFDDLPF